MVALVFLLVLLTMAFVIYVLTKLAQLNHELKRQEKLIKKLIQEPKKVEEHTKIQEPAKVFETEPVQEPVVNLEIEPVREPKINRWAQIFTVESIISKLGIFLLLVGIGYIFKLAYDNGFITESVAIMIGVLIGGALIVLGEVSKHRGRHVLSQILIGGGIATFYVSIYSAYQVYGLISAYVAFVLMIMVTTAAFLIGIKDDREAMAITGLLGGLGTPFVVEASFLGIDGFGVYVFLLVMGSMATYFVTGWKILLGSTVTGVLFVMAYLAGEVSYGSENALKLSGLMLLLWFLIKGTDYARYYRGKALSEKNLLRPTVWMVMPVFFLILIQSQLDLSDGIWALFYGGLGVIYSGLAFLLYRKKGENLMSNILVGFIGIFLCIGIVMWVGGDMVTIMIIVLSLGFYFIALKMRHRFMKMVGHIIYDLGLLMGTVRMIEDIIEHDLTMGILATHLVVIGVLTLGILMQNGLMKKVQGLLVYHVFGLIFYMGVLYQWMPDGYEFKGMILGFAFYIGLLYLLSYYADLLPIASMISLSAILLWLKLAASAAGEWMPEFVLPAIVLYGLSVLVLTDKVALWTKYLSFGVLGTIALIDLWIWSDYAGYGLLLFGLMMIFMKRLEWPIRMTWLGFFCIFAFVGVWEETFVLPFVLTSIALISMLYGWLRSFIKQQWLLLLLHGIGFFIVSAQNIGSQGTGDGAGWVTIVWAAYAIIALTIAVLKAHREMVHVALAMIVWVAAKFILVDLTTLETVWKIITAMVFGAALLALSYFLQPILKKNE